MNGPVGIQSVARERPVIMSGESVRAILSGRKKQTRRAVQWPVGASAIGARGITYPEWSESRHNIPELSGDSFHGQKLLYNLIGDVGVGMMGCPQGEPGDRLWVRESFLPDPPIDGWPGDIEWNGCGRKISGVPDHYRKPGHCLFAASWTGSPDLAWRPPIHMPRWASRLTLEITNVRAQRVQEVTEADAGAEGVVDFAVTASQPDEQIVEAQTRLRWRQRLFAEMWDTLNAKRGYPWESNPWVWAITFKVAA